MGYKCYEACVESGTVEDFYFFKVTTCQLGVRGAVVKENGMHNYQTLRESWLFFIAIVVVPGTICGIDCGTRFIGRIFLD